MYDASLSSFCASDVDLLCHILAFYMCSGTSVQLILIMQQLKGLYDSTKKICVNLHFRSTLLTAMLVPFHCMQQQHKYAIHVKKKNIEVKINFIK